MDTAHNAGTLSYFDTILAHTIAQAPANNGTNHPQARGTAKVGFRYKFVWNGYGPPTPKTLRTRKKWTMSGVGPGYYTKVSFDGTSQTAASGDTNYLTGPTLNTTPAIVNLTCSAYSVAGSGAGGPGTWSAKAEYFFELTGFTYDITKYPTP